MKSIFDKKPVTPGTILLTRYLIPNNITQKQLAAHLGWTSTRLNEIIKNKRGITADSAISLSEAFGTSSEYWMDLQRDIDLYRTAKVHVRIIRLI